MKAAAANLDFEKAAALRDDIKQLRNPRARARPARRALMRVLVHRELAQDGAARGPGVRPADRQVGPRRWSRRPFYFHDIVEQFDVDRRRLADRGAADRLLHRRGAGAAERA